MSKVSSSKSNSIFSLTNAVAVAGVGIVVLGAVQTYRRKKAAALKNQEIESKFSQRLPFLPHERHFQHIQVPIATWFQGDINKAIPFLRSRIRQILAANPWLTAEIVVYQGKDHFVFNATEELDLDHETERAFRIIDDLGVSSDSTRDQLKQMYYQLSWKENRPWRVSVLPAADNPNEFCLVTEMNHIVGDAGTYYMLYKMLINEKTPVVSMDPVRHESLMTLPTDVLGEKHAKMGWSFAFLYHAILYKRFQRNQNTEIQHFLVDPEAIKKIKSTVDPEKDGVPFITTNDIISSWYMQNTDCRYLLMSLNGRGLSPKLHTLMAGNIITSFYICADKEHATAANIRKQVKSLGLPDSELPSRYSFLFEGKHGYSINWSSASGIGKLDLPNCKELKHYALYTTGFTPSGGFFLIHRYKEGSVLISAYSGVGMKPVPCPSFAKPIIV